MGDKAKVQIIIGHRGWVHVGYVISETDTEVTIEKARCIRRWGTTQGLAHLANAGPQNSGGRQTVLDASTTMRIHPLAIMHRYDCAPAVWEAHL